MKKQQIAVERFREESTFEEELDFSPEESTYLKLVRMSN